MSSFEFVFVFLIGLLAGGGSSLLGVGGGIFIVPLIPLVIEISQRELVALSLFTVFFVVFVNSVVFSIKGLVKWRIVFLWGFFSSLGAYTSGLLTAFFDPVFMEIGLAFILCLFALLLFSPSFPKSLFEEENLKFFGKKTFFSFFVSVFGGCASGFTGVGSGVLTTSFFTHFSWLQKKNIIPTSQSITMLTSFFGAIAFVWPLKQSSKQAYFFLNNLELIRWDLFLILMLGALPATCFGLFFFQNLIPSFLRKSLLATLLLVLELKVLLSLVFF